MNIDINQENRKPIITSFLDMDFYKFTMGQFVFHRYADVPVKYASTNRTKKVRLAEIIPEKDLRRELDAVLDLKPTHAEIEFLRTQKNNGQQMFKEDYLVFLKKVQMSGYNLKVEDGQFVTEFEGPWKKSIYWETLDLSIKNELYYRELTKGLDSDQLAAVYAEGNRRLEEKFDMFQQNPFVTFLEFGTRRRWSGAWQDYCVRRAKEEIPNQIIGTSNVKLAMKYGMKPKGTMAHELFMIMSGIMHGSDDEIRASHQQVLREWFDEYGKDLSIALTDTYGSNFFFKDMPQDLAEAYLGDRQDSGNPRKFAEKQIAFYRQRGIDETKKLFVPSDALTARKIIDLQTEYRGRILQTAGWGTTYTNDLGYGNLSVVVKAVEANGHGTVKLSDNPAKSIGKPEDIARFRRIFDYNPVEYEAEECVC